VETERISGDASQGGTGGGTRGAAPRPVGPASKKPRVGFLVALPSVLGLAVLGSWVGTLIGDYPLWRAFLRLLVADVDGAGAQAAALGRLEMRHVATTLFLATAILFVVVWRGPLARFFGSMQVGVSLVIVTTLAITVGVLVPQIDGFEDPERRVGWIGDIDPALVDRYLASPKHEGDRYSGPHPADPPDLAGLTRDQVVRLKDYRLQYDAFRWAEAYFLYHLGHGVLYGAGMPSQPIPPGVGEGLDRFERVYGKEERRNREKQMEAAFSSGPKTDEIEALKVRWDPWLRRAFDFCTWADLNRTYKSNWFAALLWMLAVSVSLNTFRGGVVNWRNWVRIEKLGFFVTHLGMLTLLAGGLASNLLTDRGILQLQLGAGPETTFWGHYDPQKPRTMPFGVELEHFARKEWKALEVTLAEGKLTSRPPRYTLWPGRTIPLDYVQGPDGEWTPQVELRVVELYDHAKVGMPEVREGDAGAALQPAIELEVPSSERDRRILAERDLHVPEGATRRILLSPAMREQGYLDPGHEYRIVAAWEQDPRELFPADEAQLGHLFVEVLGTDDATPIPVPVVVGSTHELPRGYRLTIVDATKDFMGGKGVERSTHPRPLAEQPDGIRAVWVDIQAPAGSDGVAEEPERRLIFEVINAVEFGEQERYANKEVVAILSWDRWSEPGSPRFALSWGREHVPELVAQDGTRTPIELGRPLPLPGANAVIAHRVFQRASFDKKLHFEPSRIAEDGWDESFYVDDARGLVLDVARFPGTEREQVERIELATTDTMQSDLWMSEDGRIRLRFLENTDGFPYDWRSVLAIHERGPDGRFRELDLGSEKEREIRVNDYFQHGGYRFFQTNADPRDPTYSGIGVVYDPGIPTVLAGMYIVIAGTLLAFLVRPIVIARRKAAAA
jgi:hypothetical protein